MPPPSLSTTTAVSELGESDLRCGHIDRLYCRPTRCALQMPAEPPTENRTQNQRLDYHQDDDERVTTA